MDLFVAEEFVAVADDDSSDAKAIRAVVANIFFENFCSFETYHNAD